MMKHLTIRRLLGALLALSLLFSLSACGAQPQTASDPTQTAQPTAQDDRTQEPAQDAQTAADYGTLLFTTDRVHSVEVTIAEDDWADLRENPTDKTKYHATVTINGETVEDVSFATKGNTSLASVASMEDSDRYSFKINFGKYQKGQTYHGLNKLSLNNLFADATCMKDDLSYTLFARAGVDAPLVSYVWLTVNGEAQGLYLAVEDMSESYLERTQDGEGELYKPESEQLDGIGQAGGMQKPAEGGEQGRPGGAEPPEGMTFPDGQQGFPGGMTPPEGMELPEGMTLPEGMERPESGTAPDGQQGFPGGFGGFGSGANGASLQYSDDALESYSDIFDNEETDASEEDMARVVAALKALSEGDAEAALDTDEVISYFVAHNFVLNYDSYTGTMLHNYYLYEKDGKLSMLPWDYNLAFGGFAGGGDATALVNTGIDTPLSGTDEASRPMWSWIQSDEQWTEAYPAAFDALLRDYFESGDFEAEIDALYALLLPYVEQDPTAFYSAEEFTEAVETLRQFCLLRAASIRTQLDGTLSTRSDEQTADTRIDASDLDVKKMGGYGGGREGADRK